MSNVKTNIANLFNPGNTSRNKKAFAELPGTDALPVLSKKNAQTLAQVEEILSDTLNVRNEVVKGSSKSATVLTGTTARSIKENRAAFAALPGVEVVTFPKTKGPSIDSVFEDSAKTRDGYQALSVLGAVKTGMIKVSKGLVAVLAAVASAALITGKAVISVFVNLYARYQDAKLNQKLSRELPDLDSVVPAKVKSPSLDSVLEGSIKMRKA